MCARIEIDEMDTFAGRPFEMRYVFKIEEREKQLKVYYVKQQNARSKTFLSIRKETSPFEFLNLFMMFAVLLLIHFSFDFFSPLFLH